MKVALCLLVWNELEGCRVDVPKLPRTLFDEVFAVDGGSDDGTIDYLRCQGIRVVAQEGRGLNAAYWQGIETTSCDAVVFYFPKGTIPPAELNSFRRLLEEGNELVVAGRTLPGAHNEEDAKLLKPRKWMVQLLGALVALLWHRNGTWIRDILHGVRAFTVKGFREMNPSRDGLTIDLETTARAYRLKLRCAEFPTTEISRPFGRTNFPILPTGIKLLKCLLRELTSDSRVRPQ